MGMRSSVKSLEKILEQKGLRKLKQIKPSRDVLLNEVESVVTPKQYDYDQFDANLFIDNPAIQCRDKHHVKKLNKGLTSESDSDLKHREIHEKITQQLEANEFEESILSDVIHPNNMPYDDEEDEDNASISLLSLNESKNPMQFFAHLSSDSNAIGNENQDKYDGRA